MRVRCERAGFRQNIILCTPVKVHGEISLTKYSVMTEGKGLRAVRNELDGFLVERHCVDQVPTSGIILERFTSKINV